MKTKIFFLFTLLASIAASAQSHINIEMLSATYTTSPAVKFRVSWSSVPTVTSQTHNAKVWVWIDFLKLNADNTTTGNTWTRTEISATPAVNSSPASAAALDASTNKGFWLNGVTGSYSATVTASLDNIPANTKFNWCAYASDCPPNVTANNGTYTFKGTPPFTLIASNGTTSQTVTGNTLAVSALTITPTTIRDKTECPGVFCIYSGSDLYIDATHLCQQRTSGAQNWEAWIKDTRDNELYRIVLMPDNKWWLAQNVKYAGAGSVNTANNCTPDNCGRLYTGDQMSNTYTGSTGAGGYGANKQGVCSNNWILPIYDDWRTFVDAIHTVSLTQYNTGNGEWLVGTSAIICQRLTGPNEPYPGGNDYYGWADVSYTGSTDYPHSGWRNNGGRYRDWGLVINHYAGYGGYQNRFCLTISGNSRDRAAPVRCFRQL
jgi:uncharacterized protein (TIGR02145 family)